MHTTTHARRLILLLALVLGGILVATPAQAAPAPKADQRRTQCFPAKHIQNWRSAEQLNQKGFNTVDEGDLASIDFAPHQTYRTSSIQAVPGFGYIFEMDGLDGFKRYGAVRVTHVGQTFLILDWAFQTDPGNPELMVTTGGRPLHRLRLPA